MLSITMQISSKKQNIKWGVQFSLIDCHKTCVALSKSCQVCYAVLPLFMRGVIYMIVRKDTFNVLMKVYHVVLATFIEGIRATLVQLLKEEYAQHNHVIKINIVTMLNIKGGVCFSLIDCHTTCVAFSESSQVCNAVLPFFM